MMTGEIQVLQAIRLKGRPTQAQIAAAVGVDDAGLRRILRTSLEAGRCAETNGRYRLTPAGRDRLAELIAQERAGLDGAALAAAYERFIDHNAAVKRIVTGWQLVDGATANDHTDAGYDAKVIGRLAEAHDGFRPLLARIVQIAPRCAPYPRRLAGALAKVQAGEHAWLAGPLIDSYHTVWFELHEDLLSLTGLARADEAAAGRAE